MFSVPPVRINPLLSFPIRVRLSMVELSALQRIISETLLFQSFMVTEWL